MKPSIVSAGYNTEIYTCCDASTNTVIVDLQMSDASMQTDLTVSYSDASTITEEDDEHIVTPFSIEQIKDNDKMIRYFSTSYGLFSVFGLCCFKPFICRSCQVGRAIGRVKNY